MKDYLFEKPIPFVTEESEKSDNKTYKCLSRGMGKVFGNDQRNVVIFAIGLGIPAILLAFFGLILTSWGHPILMVFDLFIVLFVAWVVWSMFKMYNTFNDYARKSKELNEKYQ